MKILTALILLSQLITCDFDSFHVSTRCDDGNACTVDYEKYRIGERHDTVPRGCFYLDTCPPVTFCDTADCDDRTFCTDDWCDSTLCFHQYACDDFDVCTDDDCAGLYCIYEPVDCDDNISCTQDNCNSKDGYCLHSDTCVVIPCDTVSDPLYYDPFTGLESFCKLIVCGQNTVRSCDDGDACTNDICIEGLRECQNPEVNCDDGTDCVNAGTCWCENGYCVYGGSGKRVPVSEVKQIQAIELSRSRTTVHDVNGKLLMEILPDRVMEASMIITHNYPKGMYFIRTVTESGEIRTRKIVVQ